MPKVVLVECLNMCSTSPMRQQSTSPVSHNTLPCPGFCRLDICLETMQVGFAVAVWAEVALPQGGLFGAWGSDNYNTLMGASAALIAGAVVSTNSPQEAMRR